MTSRARRAAALEKAGTTLRFVLLDLQDAARTNPALKAELTRCKTDEEREQLAIEWFETHPQPVERSDWLGSRNAPGAIAPPLGVVAETFRTPDWPEGRLPRLEDDEPEQLPVQVAIEPELGGNPLPALPVLEALRDYAAGASIRDVAKGELSYRAARRVNSWDKSGAVWWDHRRHKVQTASGYRLVGGGSPDAQTLQLVRA